MFREFYTKFQPILDDVEVCFSDTDSLLLAIHSDSPSSNIGKIAHMMDFSNYPKNHKLHNKSNANALGFWKDELCGETLEEFIGLRSKCYCLTVKKGVSSELKSTCKGVTKAYKKTLTAQHFRDCIQQICKKEITQYTIQSKGHRVSSMRHKRVCFTSYDDKRFLLKCGIHSVPYGSCLIDMCKKKCLLC
jgi:hypothetical protein